MAQQVEIAVRLGFFTSILLALSLVELLAPRRRLTVAKAPRWTSNLCLVVLNTFTARLLIPTTAAALALLAESRSWGLLHQVHWPTWFEVVLAILAFDLAIYLQHVMFHAVPALWRLHMAH
jgi:sterol desaturase/sphingolipid hydroxylase (fatty acid hydroxylase superfamily)